MGTLYTFRMLDGSFESIRDGGLGAKWVREWALNNLHIPSIWQVSCVNFICPAHEFFK